MTNNIREQKTGQINLKNFNYSLRVIILKALKIYSFKICIYAGLRKYTNYSMPLIIIVVCLLKRRCIIDNNNPLQTAKVCAQFNQVFVKKLQVQQFILLVNDMILQLFLL